jgi:hypothetical protein
MRKVHVQNLHENTHVKAGGGKLWTGLPRKGCPPLCFKSNIPETTNPSLGPTQNLCHEDVLALLLDCSSKQFLDLFKMVMTSSRSAHA